MPSSDRIWQMLGQIAAGVEHTGSDIKGLRQDVTTIQQRQAVIGDRLERIEALERSGKSTSATPWSRPFLAILALLGAIVANAKADMVAQVILAVLAPHK